MKARWASAAAGANVVARCALRVLAILVIAVPFAVAQVAPNAVADVARWTTMLEQRGADGRESRETAIVRLLESPQPAAHQVLQRCLGRTADPDDVRLAILAALQRHLLGAAGAVFGGAVPDVRRQIVAGYAAVLCRFWDAAPAVEEEAPVNPLRQSGRVVLQRMPAQDLEAALRALLATAELETRIVTLRCIADLQQVHLAKLLAEHLEDVDAPVQTAARQALRLLTFSEEEFTQRSQFDAWFQVNGTTRYVDLAERAARLGPGRADSMRVELVRQRIEAAREFVRARSVRTPGVDWAAVSARTLVEDTAVLDACLEVLQQSLLAGTPVEDQPQPRQAFCRGLLHRWRLVAPDQTRRRALLLEVAAYVCRPEDPELVAEVTGLLLGQLDAPVAEAQIAALRGLRRFPTVEARARVVRFAMAALQQGPTARGALEAAIATLGSRAAPRWCAPSEVDSDKGDWLRLVREACANGQSFDLRDAALGLALSLDAGEHRVPEVQGLLLDLARDPGQDAKFRSACLIHLQGWRDQQGADGWVRLLHQLLEDPEPELRQLAAESLAKVPEIVAPARADWIASTIVALRNRLRVEPSAPVLRALVDSLQACGREAQMADKAIGALHLVLSELGSPVPPEHQFRLEPLLQALATIAADARADRGQWLAACRMLLLFEKRQSLRLVLQSQGAIDLAKDVANPDAGVAERAREAMKVIVCTALLKPARDAWTATEELQREARDVRIAFGALDTLEPQQRLDEPQHRLLRLEVELAAGKFADVVQRAASCLAPPREAGPNAARATSTVEFRDRVRALVAEAQLGLAKPEVAAKALDERESTAVPDARVLDLQCRIARVLAKSDPVAAIALLDRAFHATPPDDPSFRARLVEWASARVRHDPSTREPTMVELERFAPLFEAQDCPSELRDAWMQFRSQR